MITQETAETLMEAARKSHKEICGVISRNGNVYPIPNISTTTNSFLMKKSSYFCVLNQLSDDDDAVQAIYHSHPSGDLSPSEADLAFFKKSGVDMVIVSKDNWRCFSHE